MTNNQQFYMEYNFNYLPQQQMFHNASGLIYDQQGIAYSLNTRNFINCSYRCFKLYALYRR